MTSWDLFIIFFNFYWSIDDLQCHVNFCCTAKWLSYTHIYTLFLHSFPLWFIVGYWISFPVLYSRTLLFICSMYNSLHLLTPTSHSISPPTLSPLATTSLFFMSVILFASTFRWKIFLFLPSRSPKGRTLSALALLSYQLGHWKKLWNKWLFL